jgi:DNA-binding MarR family transcriptional regulator
VSWERAYRRPGDRAREPERSLRDFLPFLLRESMKAVEKATSSELREHGANWPTFAVLLVLNRIGGLSQETLASRAGLDRTTVCRLLPDLEEEGLVARAHSADRRATSVWPGPGCAATLDHLRSGVRSAEGVAFARLDDHERERLRALLQRSLPVERHPLRSLFR